MSSRTLTDDDIGELMRRLDEAEEARWKRQMESIGYDVSTPRARAEIHDDHGFVRDLRKGTGKAKMMAFAMMTVFVLGGLGHALVSGIWDTFQTAMKGHGAP